MKLFHVFGLLFLALNIQSQNLVPNPSFESYSECPELLGNFFALDWYVVQNTDTASPDYYNVCSQGQLGVPINVTGNQLAYDGSGYVGFYFYDSVFGAREYIQTQLSSPLVADMSYQVSFYVSLADKFGLAINRIELQITNEPLVGNGTAYPILISNPHIVSSGLVVSATNWYHVTGTYVAAGGEQYLTIGNFHSDNQTITVNVNGNVEYPFTNWSYYYVDNVSVIQSDLTVTTVSDQSKIGIHPNPLMSEVNLELPVEIEIVTVDIYSQHGLLVKKYNGQTRKFDLSDLSSGVYYMNFLTAGNERIVKKIIKI